MIPDLRTVAEPTANHQVTDRQLTGTSGKLWREDEPVSQRFTATFSDDGNTVIGGWEIADDGNNYPIDVDLIHRRVDT